MVGDIAICPKCSESSIFVTLETVPGGASGTIEKIVCGCELTKKEMDGLLDEMLDRYLEAML